MLWRAWKERIPVLTEDCFPELCTAFATQWDLLAVSLGFCWCVLLLTCVTLLDVNLAVPFASEKALNPRVVEEGSNKSCMIHLNSVIYHWQAKQSTWAEDQFSFETRSLDITSDIWLIARDGIYWSPTVLGHLPSSFLQLVWRDSPLHLHLSRRKQGVYSQTPRPKAEIAARVRDPLADGRTKCGDDSHFAKYTASRGQLRAYQALTIKRALCYRELLFVKAEFEGWRGRR